MQKKKKESNQPMGLVEKKMGLVVDLFQNFLERGGFWDLNDLQHLQIGLVKGGNSHPHVSEKEKKKKK